MEFRGPLMVEHRVIEQVIGAMKHQLERIRSGAAVEVHTIEECVDFLRVYADRTHHGKEEEILFHRLGSRPLTLDHRVLLEELIDEHGITRQATTDLAEAGKRHRHGDESSLTALSASLTTLVELYPGHIAKEDEVFFPLVRGYVDGAEEEALLSEFREFDRQMIHEKYQSVARSLAARESTR
jgi:hemerythrin-like domain-containing protein